MKAITFLLLNSAATTLNFSILYYFGSKEGVNAILALGFAMVCYWLAWVIFALEPILKQIKESKIELRSVKHETNKKHI